MNTNALIFDIETIADVTEDNRSAVAAMAKGRDLSPEEYATFCPPLARVVCIAWYDLAAATLGAVFDSTLPGGQANVAMVAMSVDDGSEIGLAVTCDGRTGEAELLRAFGTVVTQHFQKPNALLVTYSGRGFDLPVLIHRSVKHGVAEGRPLLIKAARENRFNPRLHIDLLDAVNFYGASSRWPLAAYAIGYGYRSPKDDMDGSQVGAAVSCGRIIDVVRYCAGDVVATTHVYRCLATAGLVPRE
jgi:hypothetical protein